MLRRQPQRIPLKQEDVDEVDAFARGLPRARSPHAAHPSAFTSATTARAVAGVATAAGGGGGPHATAAAASAAAGGGGGVRH